tara:strand:+ start:208 stop:420 length:213 start_codon:yes stop_codon:yes gene_type:complete
MSKAEAVDKINKTRLFASFRNKKELNDRLKEVFEKMPKKYQNELWLFIGQFESTLAEGFSDEKDNEKEGR